MIKRENDNLILRLVHLIASSLVELQGVWSRRTASEGHENQNKQGVWSRRTASEGHENQNKQGVWSRRTASEGHENQNKQGVWSRRTASEGHENQNKQGVWSRRTRLQVTQSWHITHCLLSCEVSPVFSQEAMI